MTTTSPNRRFAAGWAAFRRWRRSRPFWAGVFTVLGGLAILAPPLSTLTLGDIVISISTIGGVSSLLISVLMFAAAASLWWRPQFRMVAGISTLVLALVAIVTSNLGGFGIGTALGVLGAALALAWSGTPKPPRRRERKAQQGGAPAMALLLAGTLAAGLLATGSAPSANAQPAAAGDPAIVPYDSVWTLAASRAEFAGLSYNGVVETTVNGKVKRVLDLRATSLKLYDLEINALPGNGKTLVLRPAPGQVATISGRPFTFLAERLVATAQVVLSIPLDLTADRPPPLVLPYMTFTDVKALLPRLLNAKLDLPGLTVSLK